MRKIDPNGAFPMEEVKEPSHQAGRPESFLFPKPKKPKKKKTKPTFNTEIRKNSTNTGGVTAHAGGEKKFSC